MLDMGSGVTQRSTEIEIRIFMPLGFAAPKRLDPASTYLLRRLRGLFWPK
jgi:hypothetical protein